MQSLSEKEKLVFGVGQSKKKFCFCSRIEGTKQGKFLYCWCMHGN